MSCYLKEEHGEVYAVLQFKREQLLYDIKNACYIEGHIMPDDSEHGRHTTIDVGEEGNVDRVTRVLDLAVAQCREMLYAFTKYRARRPVLDDILRERPGYGIVLRVPETFSQTTLTLLERLIHEYLVCKAIADWLSITKPGSAQNWLQKAAEAETEIRTTMHARVTKTRRKLHPF